MNKYLYIFLLLTICLCSEVFSKTLAVDFKDLNGEPWHRWIIVEQQKDKTVILVTESPARDIGQRFVDQTIVDRTIFSNDQIEKIDKKIAYFQSLKDLETRDEQYYQDLQIETHNKTPNPLWIPVKNSWTLADENNFGDWYKNNASPTMTRGGGLAFDCADFGLLSRWIYAHDNKLPVANTLAGSGKLLGHFSESRLWSSLPTDPDWKKDERFKAAMKFLFDSTYTHSIFGDLYPIKINKDFVTPGSIILTLRSGDTGHTQVIFGVGRQPYCSAECISVLYGNEPERDYAYLTQADIERHVEKAGGFLRWRWPQFKAGRWQLTAKSSMPGYSLEQYQHPEMSYDEYSNYIMESLGFKIPPLNKAYSIATSLAADLNARLNSTTAGALYCYYHFCDPAGKLYDDYSTPNKDQRFREKRDQLLRLVSTLTADEKTRLKTNFNYPLFIGGTDLPPLSDYIFNINGISDKMSSDPSVSFEKRWGLEKLSTPGSAYVKLTFLTYAWQFRTLSVESAVTLCWKDGNLICNPKSPEILKLSTADVDPSIRDIVKGYKAFYSQLIADDQTNSNIVLQNISFGYGCGPSGNNECTGFEYLFSAKDYFQKMSSNPTDTYRKRQGLE